jgi:hypothetical protein
MKKIAVFAILCFLAATLGAVYSRTTRSDTKALLNDFTRSGKIDGTNLSFVLLNNKTVELLFTPPGMYQIRARASQATAFYVLGAAEKKMTLDKKFIVEQDGEKFDCEMINIENFTGGDIAKGQKIKGILQLSKKLNLSHPFVIKSAQDALEFRLTEEALKEL